MNLDFVDDFGPGYWIFTAFKSLGPAHARLMVTGTWTFPFPNHFSWQDTTLRKCNP